MYTVCIWFWLTLLMLPSSYPDNVVGLVLGIRQTSN